MENRRVFIITEGGRGVGFGHITRCLSLYQAFEEKKFSVELIINGDNSVRNLCKGYNFRILDWLENETQLFRWIGKAGIIVIDSYLASLPFYQEISKAPKVAVFIDDNKRLDYPSGVIVNSSINSKNLNYPKKLTNSYLLGNKYALLRKAFWSVPSKRIRRNIKSMMLTLGGTDSKHYTVKILRFLNLEYPELIIKVIIGRGFNDAAAIESLENSNNVLIYYPDAKRMKELMLKTDFAISAGGQTLNELARIGNPTIGVCVARNQKLNLKGYLKAGFIEVAQLDNQSHLLAALRSCIRKLTPYHTRLKKSRIGRALVDGQGAKRVVDFIMKSLKSFKPNNIRLRKAKRVDCRALWDWRNSKEVRRWAFNKNRIKYSDHKKWFYNKITDKNTIIYIAQNVRNQKIGQIRFEFSNKQKFALVNVNLNPLFLGRGFGILLIENGTKKFLNARRSVSFVMAEVLHTNIASKLAFLRAGYSLSKTVFRNNTKVLIFKYGRSK